MGGFIGSTEDGHTTTLGRGGSDYSASLVGAGVEADEIQIWTDVDGMLTADPTILPGGHRVKTISFAEAAELAYFGAKVLHPATVLPAIEKNIPVVILNSRRPEVAGTRITSEAVPCRNAVKSISCKRKHHAREHPLHPDADGAWFPAPHFRDLRPARHQCGYGVHLRSQRLSHYRQLRKSGFYLFRAAAIFGGQHRKRPSHRLSGGREYPPYSGHCGPCLPGACATGISG